jgi:hypothetical protein
VQRFMGKGLIGGAIKGWVPPGSEESTSGYAFFVSLQVPYATTRYSDNYFDLLLGEQCTVVVTNADTTLAPEVLVVGWG